MNRRITGAIRINWSELIHRSITGTAYLYTLKTVFPFCYSQKGKTIQTQLTLVLRFYLKTRVNGWVKTQPLTWLKIENSFQARLWFRVFCWLKCRFPRSYQSMLAKWQSDSEVFVISRYKRWQIVLVVFLSGNTLLESLSLEQSISFMLIKQLAQFL